MKKTEKRKLHIHGETLRVLQDSKLGALRGGLVPADSGAETCGTTTLSCFMRCTG
jgi:hypothetical protein